TFAQVHRWCDSPMGVGQEARLFMRPSDVIEHTNLTEAQALFWLGHHLQKDVPLDTHTTTFAFSIDGELSHAHFQAAFQRLLDGSDALRSVIVEDNGIPRRRTIAHLPYAVPLVTLMGQADPRQACRQWVEQRWAQGVQWHERSFDCALLHLSSSQYVWYLQLHHTIGDARSFWLIAKRVAEYYRAPLDGCLGPTAVPLEPTFEAYAEYERRFRSTRRYARNQEYWQKKVAASQVASGSSNAMRSADALRTYRISY